MVRRIRTARESCYASPCPNTAYKPYYDGRAEQAINLRCSERDAKKRARKLATEGPVELWEGSRAIARYEASGTARARGLLGRPDWLTIACGVSVIFLAALVVYLMLRRWPEW